MIRTIGTTEDGHVVRTCPVCQGTGKIFYITPKGYTKIIKHDRCEGTGIILKIA